MADDVWNAASRGDAAEVRRLIDRGGDVHYYKYKEVRIAFATRPRPPRRRVRALRPKEPAGSAQWNPKRAERPT